MRDERHHDDGKRPPRFTAADALRRLGSGLCAATLSAWLAAMPACAAPLIPKTPLYGVTLEDLSQLDAILASLRALPHRPTVRVVFHPRLDVGDYREPVRRLHEVAYVMGEIWDSYYFPADESAYLARTRALLLALKDDVDIWEIGNEINGEWLRPPGATRPAQIEQEARKIGRLVAGAFDLVKAAGGQVAITLFYNADGKGHDCVESPLDAWPGWPRAFLPQRVRQGADYAFFSYYPYGDCPGLEPDWPADFARLGRLFPRAKLGFGEIGTSSAKLAFPLQRELITRFYPMADTLGIERFVGGYFWWNYASQMVPHASNPYWETLRATLAPLKPPK